MADDIIAGDQRMIGLVSVGIVYALLTGFVFWDTNLEIVASPESTQTLLNSLAIAQSSAVAIVASVTLLNVQLVADRYSTELVKSSLRSSPFKIVLFAFFASIAFDLILVYNIEHHSTVWFTAAVVVAAAWALVNAFGLYKFIFSSVGVLTPRSLITTITGRGPREIADQTSSFRDTPSKVSPSDSVDQEEPLYQLFVIITSSVGSVDYYVVQEGLNELRSILEDAIEDLEEPDATKLCQKSFLFYYPRIVDKCIENAEIEQAEQAVSDLTGLLKVLETEAGEWHNAHFAGIRGLFRIRDGTTDESLIEDETIPARLEDRPGQYWSNERLESVLAHAESEIEREESQMFCQELIANTHMSVINSGQTTNKGTARDPITLWEQEMRKVLKSAVRTHRTTEPQASRQFLSLWTQLYQRTMTNLSSHRKWLVTVIFELSIFHTAHHEGEYEAGKDALLSTLRGAQPEHTRDRIETLQGLTERQIHRQRQVPILDIDDMEGHTETAYRYDKLAGNMASEAIDAYRKQNWNTDKAVKYIRSQPCVIRDYIDDFRFTDSPIYTEYTLITDPKTADGHIVKLVISEEINSDVIDSLSLDGVSRYLCIGPVVTGDFDDPDIETIERSLPELRPPTQTSIYDYYDWS